MTFAEIRKEVDVLDSTDQEKLFAYLQMLHNSRDENYEATLSRRMNDSSPEAWVSLDDFKRELGDE
ncbi:MAG: hypothetical protein ACQKBV_11490 [Puniceicoccales bacterium]